MVDYSAAINDLRFLENRFRNLMEIVPHLIEMGSYEDAVSEAKRQIEALKEDIASLASDKAKAEDALGETQKVLDNRKTDFEAWIATQTQKAKDDADNLLKDAKDKAKDILNNAKAKSNEADKAVEARKVILADLESKLSTTAEQYDLIQTKLQTIKASL